jgi:hypothetical protein
VESGSLFEEYLLDRRWLLAALALVATVVSALMAIIGQKHLQRHSQIRLEQHPPLGVGDRLTRTSVGQLIMPVAFVAIFVAFAMSLSRDGFGAIAGGLMVGQTVGAMLSLGNLLNLQLSSRPGSAAGELTYSAAYRYGAMANQLLAGSLIVLLAFVLRGGPMLFGGGVFLVVLALGYYRRGRQARRRLLQSEKPSAA